MTYNSIDLLRMTRELASDIENDICKAGIFCRIFHRSKEGKSLYSKLENRNEDGLQKYDGVNKFIRDVIGIRVILYFTDDLEIVENYFKEKFKTLFVEETIDLNNTTEFKPTRINIIYRLPDKFINEFREVINNNKVDTTFELQLRTIISEGWHEVEHDFRYKCSEDWILYPNLERTYNGYLASLETHEWGIIRLFEQLSHNHYKAANFSPMIRTKLRLRVVEMNNCNELDSLFNTNSSLLKKFFKIERNKIVILLLYNRVDFPLTLDNLIYFINYFYVKNDDISRITPRILKEYFKRYTDFSN